MGTIAGIDLDDVIRLVFHYPPSWGIFKNYKVVKEKIVQTKGKSASRVQRTEFIIKKLDDNTFWKFLHEKKKDSKNMKFLGQAYPVEVSTGIGFLIDFLTDAERAFDLGETYDKFRRD